MDSNSGYLESGGNAPWIPSAPVAPEPADTESPQPDIAEITYRVFELVEPALKQAISQAVEEYFAILSKTQDADAISANGTAEDAPQKMTGADARKKIAAHLSFKNSWVPFENIINFASKIGIDPSELGGTFRSMLDDGEVEHNKIMLEEYSSKNPHDVYRLVQK